MKDEKIAIALNEIFEAFSEEMERKIKLKEFFCLMLWSLKNVSTKPFNTITTSRIEGIIVVLKPQPVKIESTDLIEVLGALNDNRFITTMDFVAELANENLQLEAYEDAVKFIFHSVTNALQKFNHTPFEDADNLDIKQVDVKFIHQKKVRIKQGDIISIPLNDATFALAIMIEKTSFGTGYGIFRKRYATITFKALASDMVLQYQLFTIDEPVETGKWKIVFNDKNLLDRFPKKVEKYHSPMLFDTAKPYGLGETSDGLLRKLSKEEADEKELFSEDFEQVLLPEEMEAYLNKKL